MRLQSWRYEIRTIKCYTAEEIGEVVGLSRELAQKEIEALLVGNEDVRKSVKVTFSEADYAPPIYNVGPHGASMKKPRQRSGWRLEGQRKVWKHYHRITARHATRSANALALVAQIR